MKYRKMTGKLYDAIYEIKHFSQIGSAYLDAHEEIEEMVPLSMIFRHTQKKIDRINNILQYKLKI